MKKQIYSLKMVSLSVDNSLTSDSVRRIDKETKKPYIDKTPTTFVEADGVTYEAIASNDKKAVVLTSRWEDVEEEVKPEA
jgi:hypothetical protein